jgi:hypothetical protein
VDILFYLRSDGQHILPSDTIMAVFLSILILCGVLKEGIRSIGTSQSIIINKNTAMIESLTKIYFISDLKKKKTPIVYQNLYYVTFR